VAVLFPSGETNARLLPVNAPVIVSIAKLPDKELLAVDAFMVAVLLGKIHHHFKLTSFRKPIRSHIYD